MTMADEYAAMHDRHVLKDVVYPSCLACMDSLSLREQGALDMLQEEEHGALVWVSRKALAQSGAISRRLAAQQSATVDAVIPRFGADE